MPPKRKTPPTDAHAGPSRRDRDHSRDSSRQISRETGVGSGDGDRTTSRRDRAGYWAVAGGDVEWGWNTQPRQPHPQSHSQSEQSQSVSQSQSQQSVLQSQQQQEQDDPAVSALELMYRWLEVPGHWVRFREARAGAERQAVAQLCSDWLDENDTPVPRSWNECEAKLIEMHRLFSAAFVEETATGFADDGRPRLGSLIASAENTAKENDEKAKHYSSGLLLHVRGQLNRLCGGLDYYRLKEVFGDDEAGPRAGAAAGAAVAASQNGGGSVVGDPHPFFRNGSVEHGHGDRIGLSRTPGVDGRLRERLDDMDMHLLHAPRTGYDPIEDEARDAALAAYRSTKARLAREADIAAEHRVNAEEARHRAIMDLAKLAHEMDPTLRPIVAYRTALTMYIAQMQTLGE